MSRLSIVIVDYGVGNVQSVFDAIRELRYQNVRISSARADIMAAEALILPGVGAFGACVKELRRRNLDEILGDAVLNYRKPILGICVGMQMMATESEENGSHLGLNWIPGRISKLNLPKTYAVPHVGWNEINTVQTNGLFSRLTESPCFYFDHGYHFEGESKFVTAVCDYGAPITAAIATDNIYGVQFHPEKSQKNGLKLLRGFFTMVSEC
jgi:glutamine amidotransferase